MRRCSSSASDHPLGVDAIIHVASPLPSAATTEVILDVSNIQASFLRHLVDQALFLDGRCWDRAHTGRCSRRRRQETRRHREHGIACPAR